MFYSHNLLAKKGPLGTVWCAAHLQNRLKKSNYITINIPSTVEQIMNPQAPIALRLSGHLLLGVVRIYSKKVEYLQHDYNALSIEISKTYAYADINLPQDANQAKFESITLPDNFALDLMDIDNYNPNGYPDTHLMANEEISLTDQTPISISKRGDQTPAGYVKISLGEASALRTPSLSLDNSGPHSVHDEEMSIHEEEIPHPHTPRPTIEGFPDPDANNLPNDEDNRSPLEHLREPNHGGTPILPKRVEPDLELEAQFTKKKSLSPLERLREPNQGGTPILPERMEPDIELEAQFAKEKSLSPLERLREPNHGGTPILPERVEPDLELEALFTKEKSDNSLTLEDVVDQGVPKQTGVTRSPESAHSEHEHELVQDNSVPPVSYGLAPSPQQCEPVVPEQPRVKRRRLRYDKATVLSNEFMKKSLDDASDLKRKRKGVSSLLGAWKLNNAYKKEHVLFGPIIDGLGDNRQMFEEDYISSKPDLFNTEQAEPDARKVGQSDDMEGSSNPDPFNTEQPEPDTSEIRQSADVVGSSNLFNTEQAEPDAAEIRRSADFVNPSDNDMIPINSPDNRSFSSPPPEDKNTPAITTDGGSKSYQTQTTAGTDVGFTPDPTSSVGSFVSETETPFPFLQSRQGFENSGGLSDIPEVDDNEELACLEDDNEGTPSLRGTPDTDYSSGRQRPPPEAGSLLPRTKAVAQHIKEKSSATPSSSENSGSVSMKSILEGKTRKVCSRFFFETLVLKSCDLVDVKQDEPYGDITLKVTPKLSKLQMSS
uniref:sister chromatid cohesion 1 protein 3 n=1 Tax=Erigeron canadensis TaxID=72917 RepID=UPI001CB8EDEC|nr:sister chromatid cohesion 1 protein 3 [Erigeron canadensis]